VVGLVDRGAWAEEVVVQCAQVAVIPDSVKFAQAATLGGIGHFACQLGVRAGAHVVALAGFEPTTFRL
jgi:NADPH:quinone reductase-like Zn-dependent oxidoreductase